MKIEVKKVQHFARMSHETLCFACDVWIDGKMVGTAENDGQGGPDNIILNPRSLENEAETYAKTLPPIDCGDGTTLEMDLELLIGNLVQKHINQKEETATYKRWCKKSTVFMVKGDKEGSFRTLKNPYSLAAKLHLMKKYGNDLVEILNERFTPIPIPTGSRPNIVQV